MRATGYDGSFRTWQAVGDLVHHIGPLLTRHLGALAQAMGVTPRAAGDAVRLLRDEGFAFRGEGTLALMDGAETLAIKGDQGFDLAVVMLLADLLQSRAPQALLADVWPEAAVRLRDWPATLRAAVANGLVRARELGLIQMDPLDPVLCVTRPAEAIAEHLLQIARSMRREDLAAVAQADYGRDAERHHAALLDCISRRDGIFPPDDTWFPSEVVELCAHDPSHPGYPGCTAILLLNVLQNGDPQDWFGFRWHQQAAAYGRLKPSQRDPILAGVRYIYETDAQFLESDAVVFYPARGVGQVIPVVEGL